ncbi:hypothetical protein ABBQ38_008661 [Trebouxia sp. C0009 RCD-2024]
MLRLARPIRSAVVLSVLGRQYRSHVCVMTVSSPSNTKSKRKMVQIGTHNGTFHCDEALGCFMLQKTERFGDAEVVRTRDQDLLKDLDIVIDVGGVYDPKSERYDHHQRGFTEVFGHGFVTKLSSAGLVYKHFGKELVAAATGHPADSSTVETTWLAVYKYFMEAVDGIDNGINQYESNKPARYVNNTNLSSRVANLNPPWNGDQSEQASNAQFQKAMQLTGLEFMEALEYYSKSWLPARALVQQAIEGRHGVDPSGSIIKLPMAGCPWKEHLAQLEEEQQLGDAIKFCLYEDTRAHAWRVQTVPVEPGSFQSRKPLPKAWMGVRDQELDSVSGIPGCIFVHASGFIGGNKTYEGTLEMARQGLTRD